MKETDFCDKHEVEQKDISVKQDCFFNVPFNAKPKHISFITIQSLSFQSIKNNMLQQRSQQESEKKVSGRVSEDKKYMSDTLTI